MTQQQADLIIRNVSLIDGSGKPAMLGDIAITDERIVALGEVRHYHGANELNATGKALAPGFIDVHTHDDRALLSNPLMSNKISQGVTTVVTGNCGISLAPLSVRQPPPPPLDLIGPTGEEFYPEFSSYLKALHQDPPALNAICQVGHSSLRVGTLDHLDRPATNAEIKTMRAHLENSLAAGAIGLSTGLFYRPARAAPSTEIIELAQALKAYGGIHTTHMRDEADFIVDSLQETFHIGRSAEVPVVISHHKCAGQSNHGRSRQTLALIEQARQQQRIGLDVYPYTASSTVLDLERMQEASKVLITWSQPHPEAGGRELQAIAADWNLPVEQAAARLQPAGAIYFMMAEEDVRRILRYPQTMIGSDGLPHDAHPHPRLWGSFPRVLGHYAREVGLFTLEEAVRRMSGLPASQFGLKERGVLRPGAYADMVLFDPATVIDRATFETPTLSAAGIERVWVNGRLVWRDGTATGARPGRVLRLGELGPLGSSVSTRS